MQTEVVTAIIAGSVSMLISIIGFAVTQNRWRSEFDTKSKNWKVEQEIRMTELAAEVLKERISKRYEYYPAVFKILGTVRDIPDPSEEHYAYLEEHRDELEKTGKYLIAELYGEAGLVMEKRTRDILLEVYTTSLEFAGGAASIEDLRLIYLNARRQLRADLQLIDNPDIDTELERLTSAIRGKL